jgi:Fur family ferric uptake transcriptional regulator
VASFREEAPEALRAEIDERLRRGGVRVSEPRRAVIDALLASHGHISSEELALELRHRGPRVSLSTVYRCLRRLVDAGIAREIRVGDTSRFEIAVGRDAHDHLVCSACGRIVEFDRDHLGEHVRRIATEYGFSTTSPRVQISSTCAACG